jgi:hypothetical protein
MCTYFLGEKKLLKCECYGLPLVIQSSYISASESVTCLYASSNPNSSTGNRSVENALSSFDTGYIASPNIRSCIYSIVKSSNIGPLFLGTTGEDQPKNLLP